MMRAAFLFASALALSACTVGPKHVDANVPLPPSRAPATITPASGPAQQVTAGARLPTPWWHSFGSAKLDALVAQALAHNNDLATAEATLRQAIEQARVVSGNQGPQIDANYQAQRVRLSKALSAPLADNVTYLYTTHTAQLTVNYPVDLFGAGRNKVRSARAQADIAAARLDAARTTDIANLVLAVIAYASLQDQIAATRAAVQSNGDLVALLQRRRALGDIAESDVTAQQAALATAEAALPPLQRQAEHQAALILTLTGRPAGSAMPELPAFAELTLPADLPLGVPAGIVADRPDVRAAAAQMRGAAADLGSAIAARLPGIQLTADGGGLATHISDLFSGPNLFYSLLGSVTQPIFHSGALLHQQRAARAELAGAEAQYRGAALQAFLDVDDALSGLQTDAAALDAAARADTAARRTLELTRRQVELGALGTLQLLTASASASQAAGAVIQARAARLTDSVAFFQATGAPSR